MCLQRWPLGAWSSAVGTRHVRCTSNRHGLPISTRKPSEPLGLSSNIPSATSAAAKNLTVSNKHCPLSYKFDDYANESRIPNTPRDVPTLLNHRWWCQFCKKPILKDAQFQYFSVRDLWDIALFVHLVLVSAAVVSVVVSLCVRRTVCALHARTSLDTCTTASSHHRSTISIPGPVFLATVCLALAVLTIATRCYASTATATTTTSSASSHPSQSHAFTNRVVVEFSSQTVPSSIAQSQSSLSRDYFSSRRKSGRLKRRANGVDNATFLYRSSAADNLTKRDQITVVQTLVNNITSVENPTTSTNNNSSSGDNNITSNSDTSVARVSERLRVNNNSGPGGKQSTVRPMPPVHDQPTHTVSGDIGGGTGSGDGGGGGGRQSFVALVISAALLTATLGLITCVVNYYRAGGGGGGGGGTLPPGTTLQQQQHSLVPVLQQHDQQQYEPVRESSTHTYFTPSTSAPMLSVVSASAAGMDGGGGGAAGRLHRHVTRELAVQRDRQVRLHSVHTDLELDLPPSIALPDGEELPYGSSARLHIRDPEQESEIYQKCIRPPPNRTVFESESPPPYRSSSAGLLGSLGGSTSSNSTGAGVGGSSDWSGGSTPFVVRCHSMSSTSTTNKRTLDPQVATSSSASSAGGAGGGGGQKTDFLQRTVKIFTGKKNTSQPPQPAPTLPVVVVPTSVRTTRRDQTTAPARTKPQGNV